MRYLIPLVFVMGCATAPKPIELQNYSAGYTGCDPEDIKVSNWTPGQGFSTWKAKCDGKAYRCTASMGGTSCKERK